MSPEGDVNQVSSQPKITSDDVILEPIAESLKKKDEDDIKPVPPLETKLTNQVVEPMSRGNDTETATAAANVYMAPGEEVKSDTKGVAKYIKKLIRDDSMDVSEVSKCCWCWVGVCTCCTACCACLLCIPCLAVTMVLNCLLCPVNTAITCCCPSRAQPITIQFDDFQSMFNSWSD